MNLSGEKQTGRLLRAIDNPRCQVIGHMRGRRILERDPFSIDLEKVLKAARDTGCMIEINADPHRLDLDDNGVRIAKDIGAKFTISSDAHSVNGLGQMMYGVWTARRGWMEKKNVVNSGTVSQVRKSLRRS